ncbi:MAG: transglutaminase-like domain-containing protein [Chloroflexi bacterium]|nr:transglutaminase-like domain-containing protein [Chloroflexota bacterium]MDA1004536.1 transglutaminase-like domain-containing protein [Chloroflexota bacterium]
MSAFQDTLARFQEATSGPADAIPLARAALVAAGAEYVDIDINAFDRRLDDMAETLTRRLQRDADGPAPSLRPVQTLNQLLYTELGFRGNADHYDDPRNLYLNVVLTERTGIPVTLAIVYTEVARRAGLDVRVIGLPGHVIARYQSTDDAEPTLIDVFNRGRVLSEQDCEALVRNVFGTRVQFKPHYMAALTPRQVLQRLLHNLKAGYLQRGDEGRSARVIDLLLALFPWDLDEIRDRGMLHERLGDYPDALRDLEQYVQYRAGARDIQTVTETVRSLRRHASGGQSER